MDKFVTVAKIVKVRGTRGETSAQILTDFPERFADRRSVRLSRSGYTSFETIQQHRFHQDRVLLKFVGRDLPEEVAELVGCEVQVPVEQRVPLPQYQYYNSDLVDCVVVEGGRRLGVVSEVFRVGERVSNLVVKTEEQGEFMIPCARVFVSKVDIEAKRIEVSLPPGLVELTVTRSRQ